MDGHLFLLWDGAVLKKELKFSFTFAILPMFPDLAGLRR